MTELQKAIEAIKAGDKQTGEKLLRRLLETEPDNEAAWLWLATGVNSRSEKICYLAKVLGINPDNDTAQRGIARLQKLPETSPRLKRLKPEIAEDADRLTWDEVWFNAVSRPSVATFEHILTNSQVSVGRAFVWLGLSSMVAAALGFMLTLIVERLTSGQVIQQAIITLIVGVTIGPVVGVLVTALFTGLTQWVAGLLGGLGTFNRLIYVQAAYAAPLGIILAALAPIPVLNLLNIILYIYVFVLSILAVQAVNRFSTGKAIAAVFIPGIALGLLIGCGTLLFVFTLAGVVAGR